MELKRYSIFDRIQLAAAQGFSTMLDLSFEAYDPHNTYRTVIWDLNDECSRRNPFNRDSLERTIGHIMAFFFFRSKWKPCIIFS